MINMPLIMVIGWGVLFYFISFYIKLFQFTKQAFHYYPVKLSVMSHNKNYIYQSVKVFITLNNEQHVIQLLFHCTILVQKGRG